LDSLQNLIDKAPDGDVQAAGLVLARVAPVLRLQAERVDFTLDAKAPLAEQVEACTQAPHMVAGLVLAGCAAIAGRVGGDRGGGVPAGRARDRGLVL
jgi:hypothetical protein